MINDNRTVKKKRTINRIAKLHLFMKLNNIQCYGHIRKSEDGLVQWGYKNINGEDVHNLYKANEKDVYKWCGKEKGWKKERFKPTEEQKSMIKGKFVEEPELRGKIGKLLKVYKNNKFFKNYQSMQEAADEIGVSYYILRTRLSKAGFEDVEIGEYVVKRVENMNSKRPAAKAHDLRMEKLKIN